MAALTAARIVPNAVHRSAMGGFVIDAPMENGVTIHKGGFVSILTGGTEFARALAAGDVFLGIALESKTNSGADGAATCSTWIQGMFQHLVGSVAQANVGDAIYASDDQTLTLVRTPNSSVGRVVAVPVAGTAIIQMKRPGEALAASVASAL